MGCDHRVMVLGLDCASPDLVFQRWRDELPNFKRLMQKGRFGYLRSTDPPITVPAWTSMVTGKDPGELGCYGFRNRKDYSYDNLIIADSKMVREPTIWQILSRRKLRSVVLGVPQTYPPRPLNGIMVSGFLAPDENSNYTYPRDFREELHRITGGYIIDVRNFRTDQKNWLLSEIFTMTRRRFRAIRHLLKNQDWSFFMAVEMGPDRIHHGFWKYFDPTHPRHPQENPYRDTIKHYYRLLDEELEGVVELLDPQDSLLVVSDHGAQPMMGGVCINEWLMEKGLLNLKVLPHEPRRFAPELVDWSKTKAWSEGGYYARVFFNVRGREPHGTIHPNDYERFRQDLIEMLRAMEGPDGKPLGNRVLVPEEIYAACNGVPPDLMVYLGDLRWRSIGSVGMGRVFTSENDTGPDDANHHQLGLFILYEPWKTDETQGPLEADIQDIAPTVLDRVGIALPDDIHGCPIR